jgi:hypothetical protein
MAAALGPIALQQLPRLEETTRRIRDELAHSFGLTEDEDHEGWWILAALLAETYIIHFRQPLKTAVQIETQIVGVLDQVYNYLGGLEKDAQGVASAAVAGAKAVESWAQKAEHDLDPFDW